MKSPNRSIARLLKWGCLGLLFFVTVLVATVWWAGARGSRRAIALRESLEERYGTTSSFTPSLDGRIPAGRMQAFLEVRRRLMPFCAEVEAFDRQMSNVETTIESMERQGEAEARKELGGLIAKLGSLGQAMGGLPHLIGVYPRIRNETLLEMGMGIGEYTWIYVVSYTGALSIEPVPFVVERDVEKGRVFHGRIRPEVREMIARLLAQLEIQEVAQEEITFWRKEMESLDTDPDRLPFAEGLPVQLEASLRPYLEELESLSCPVAVEIDLSLTEQDGLAFEHL